MIVFLVFLVIVLVGVFQVVRMDVFVVGLMSGGVLVCEGVFVDVIEEGLVVEVEYAFVVGLVNGGVSMRVYERIFVDVLEEVHVVVVANSSVAVFECEEVFVVAFVYGLVVLFGCGEDLVAVYVSVVVFGCGEVY